MRALLMSLGLTLGATSCFVDETLFVPAAVTPQSLCEHLAADTPCPQGSDDDCPDSFRRARINATGCEAAQNAYLRCLWVDLPDDAEREVSTVGTCIASEACDVEDSALCECETGAPCD